MDGLLRRELEARLEVWYQQAIAHVLDKDVVSTPEERIFMATFETQQTLRKIEEQNKQGFDNIVRAVVAVQNEAKRANTPSKKTFEWGRLLFYFGVFVSGMAIALQQFIFGSE